MRTDYTLSHTTCQAYINTSIYIKVHTPLRVGSSWSTISKTLLHVHTNVGLAKRGGKEEVDM